MDAPRLLPRVWAPCYQRNNKTNGRKNLRCFVRPLLRARIDALSPPPRQPECSPAGHQPVRYCGNSIEVFVPPSGSSTPRILGELRVATDPRWANGDVVPSEEVQRCFSEADANLLEARSGDRGVFCFDSSGWNYTHRLDRNAPVNHAFHVYVLTSDGPGSLRVSAVVSSPSFRLKSHLRVTLDEKKPKLHQTVNPLIDSRHYFSSKEAALATSTSMTPQATHASPAAAAADDDDDDDDDMSFMDWIFNEIPSLPSLPTPWRAESVRNAGLVDAPPPMPTRMSSFFSLVREPIFQLIAVPPEESRKRSAQPQVGYEKFLQDMPGEIDTFVDSIAGLSVRDQQPAGATNDGIFFHVRSVAELEELLPIGVNVLMLLTPSPVCPDAVKPEVEGRWRLPAEVIFSDLSAMQMSSFMRWTAGWLFVGLTDKTVESRRIGSDIFEITLPQGYFNVASVLLKMDASEQEYRASGPLLQNYISVRIQAWAVGPVAVVRFKYSESCRVDRCTWRRDDGMLGVVYLYQSVGGHCWGGQLWDKRLALLSGDWVINSVTYMVVEPA